MGNLVALLAGTYILSLKSLDAPGNVVGAGEILHLVVMNLGGIEELAN